jgi:hypothetical protein
VGSIAADVERYFGPSSLTFGTYPKFVLPSNPLDELEKLSWEAL